MEVLLTTFVCHPPARNKAKELMSDYYGKADDFETAANEAIARITTPSFRIDAT